MLRSENLYKVFDKCFSEVQKDLHKKRDLSKYLFKKYGYSDIDYMQYVIGAQNKEEMSDAEVYWLSDGFNEIYKAHIDVKTYFSDKEIVRFSNLKADYSKQDFYPIKIGPVLEVAEDQWVTKGSIDLLKDFYDKQLIVYNPRTQRQLKQKQAGEGVIYTIDIVNSSIKAIQDLLEKGEFVPNALSLNLNVDDPDVDFDIVDSYLVINSGKFDIIDGFHRFRAAINTKVKNPDFQFNFILNIMNFSEEKACHYIEQEDKRNKISKKYLAAMDKSSSTNIIIDKLNNTLDSPVRGMIERGYTGCLDRTLVFTLLEYIYKSNTMNRSQCIRTGTFIINTMKILKENNPDIAFNNVSIPVILYGASISEDVYICVDKIEKVLKMNVPLLTKVTEGKMNKIINLFKEV